MGQPAHQPGCSDGYNVLIDHSWPPTVSYATGNGWTAGPGNPFTGTPVVVNGLPDYGDQIREPCRCVGLGVRKRSRRSLPMRGKATIRQYRGALLGMSAVFLIVLVFWSRFVGKTMQYAVSPDGRNVAEYREYKQSSATSTDLSTIELRARLSPIRHTVLSGLDYGGRLSVKWLDSRNLLVTCTGCNPLCLALPRSNCTAIDVVRRENKWRDVSIHYILQ